MAAPKIGAIVQYGTERQCPAERKRVLKLKLSQNFGLCKRSRTRVWAVFGPNFRPTDLASPGDVQGCVRFIRINKFGIRCNWDALGPKTGSTAISIVPYYYAHGPRMNASTPWPGIEAARRIPLAVSVPSSLPCESTRRRSTLQLGPFTL